MNSTLSEQTKNPPTTTELSPARRICAVLRVERSPADMISALSRLERPKFTKALKREIAVLFQEMAELLEADHKQEALATALAAMFADADYAIGKMRRMGVLRASKYGYRGLLIANICKTALKARSSLVARSERFDYLESVIALTKLAPSAKALHDKVLRIVGARGDTVLKTVLAVLNSRFYYHNPADVSLTSRELDRYTIEDVSDAASLILDVYRQIFPIDDNCCNAIDVEGVAGRSPVYERLFVAAIRLTKFHDAETMIDGLPFHARWDRGAVRVSSIDPDVEKSIRLGYVQGQVQATLRARHLAGSDPPISVREMIETGFKRGAFDRLVELAEKPVRRLRLFLPTAPEVFRLFRTGDLFRDELENLLMIDADTFTKLDPHMPVAPLVTVMDLFKVQRYFNFISCLYQRKLETIQDEADRAYLTFASTIPIIAHEQLLEQITLVLENKAKARAIINLLAIDYEASHLDLQYTPLVDLGQHYVVAPHVLAASNLIRNVTVAKKLRGFALEPGDPMVTAVIEAFKAAGFKVRGDVEVTINKKTVELDVVAWRDNVLFILECKNAYHPCSAHETRNSFEHIRTARNQLDVRCGLFREPAAQTRLFASLGWDIEPTARLFTGIVIANRIFHGAEFNGHPVRQAHELINVLRSGTIGGDADLRFWKGDTFATEDLVDYLAGDSIAKKQLQAMEVYPIEIDLGGRRLIFESYALDTQRQLEIMTESYGSPGPDQAANPAETCRPTH